MNKRHWSGSEIPLKFIKRLDKTFVNFRIQFFWRVESGSGFFLSRFGSGSATAAQFLDNAVAEKGNFVTIDLSAKLLLLSSVKLFTQFYHNSSTSSHILGHIQYNNSFDTWSSKTIRSALQYTTSHFALIYNGFSTQKNQQKLNNASYISLYLLTRKCIAKR